MFKLLELTFIDHPFFKALPISFVDLNEEQAGYYTTLIIGPNGTGKSQILLAAVAIFNSLEDVYKNRSKKYVFAYHYILKFTNKGVTHTISYIEGALTVDGKPFNSGTAEINFPSKILVSAFSFNDKYPFREQRGKVVNERYHYLGLKSTSNNIFIYNPAKQAIANLYESIIAKKDILPLREAFTTLELKPEIKLVFKPGKHFKFLQNNEFWDNKNQTHSQFASALTEFMNKKRRKSSNPELKRLGSEKITKILATDEDLQIITAFLNENIRLITSIEEKELTLRPFLNFDDKKTYEKFTSQVKPLQLLSDLELISFQRFELKKIETNFSFDDASSGEYHIILTYLNILSLIEENSLVLLDEPEISLHPNWQIKYMHIFNKVFDHFPKSHFIIASHSHFIVSDLKSENSHILAIDMNDKGKIVIRPTQKNTYGWSTEQILLDVFKVATTRNFYINKIVTDVLKELSQEKPKYKEVKKKLEEIIFLNTDDFKDYDPIKEIFSELKELYTEL